MRNKKETNETIEQTLEALDAAIDEFTITKA